MSRGARASIVVLGGWLLGAIPSVAAEEPARVPGARVERMESLRRWDVVPPGQLVSYALPRRADGGRDVALLVAPSVAEAGEPPRGEPGRLPPCPEAGAAPSLLSIFLLRPGEVQLVPWQTDLPADFVALGSADLDGDGAEEILASGSAGLYRVGAAQLDLIAEGVGLRRRSQHQDALARDGGDPPLWTTTWGNLRVFDDRRDGAAWREIATVELPLRARVRGTEVEIRDPDVEFVGRRNDGTLLFATEPEAAGGRRLRTLLIEIAPADEVTLTDAWSGLPAMEEVLEHRFLMLDGEPALLVTSRPSDRLSLLGEKLLRIFPLERDRSRLGIAPSFTGESRINLWQDAVVSLADADGDGREDLVIAYWKGLVTDRIVLDVYLREKDGTFRVAARTTAFDVKGADTDFLLYGDDLDGDDRPDLVLVGAGGLRLHAGLPSRNGKKIVATAERPIPFGSWASERDHEIVIQGSGPPWKTPDVSSYPRLADLDGDGRPEVLLIVSGSRTDPGAFRALWLER